MLDGAIFYPTSKRDTYPAILFVHGWTADKTGTFQYAEALANDGFICFLFDMRGHGMSEGDRNALTYKDFFDDVITAYDRLLEIEGVDPENISAVGSSFGGYLIALLSSKRKLKSLVLRAPADYPNELFATSKIRTAGNDPTVVKWREHVKEPNETFALEALHDFSGDVLLIESENDDYVPHQTILNYINAVSDQARVTHCIIKGAPHSINEGPLRDQVEKKLTDWFMSQR